MVTVRTRSRRRISVVAVGADREFGAAVAGAIAGLALSHTVTTYDGRLTIAPVCDRQMMPDPDFYYECLRASFGELRDAAKTATERARTPRRKAS